MAKIIPKIVSHVGEDVSDSFIEEIMEENIRIVKDRIKATLRFPSTSIQIYLHAEEMFSWLHEQEYIGDLTEKNGEYLLDGVGIGNRDDARKKIVNCIQMIDNGTPSPSRLLCLLSNFLEQKVDMLYIVITTGVRHKLKNMINSEKKAVKLACDMLGNEFVTGMTKNRYMRFKDRNGKEYKININGGVYSMPNEKFICLHVVMDHNLYYKLPIFDKILTKYLILRDNPDAIKDIIGENDEEYDNEDVVLDDAEFVAQENEYVED
jgi:hypothetical protein